MFFIYLAPIYDLPYTKTSASFANRFVDLRAAVNDVTLYLLLLY